MVRTEVLVRLSPLGKLTTIWPNIPAPDDDDNNDDDFNFNSIQFIIYVPSQQLQGQLQTQHSIDTIIIIVKQ
jgi:hypothetical protein